MVPENLKEGSVIGITCPSGYVSADRVSYACTVLEKWGFKVRIGKTVGTEHFYFSGTDEARAADLQSMLDDPAIDAILMGRGGYGMSRIIDRLSFDAFRLTPKWICGFSDITVLHNHLQAQVGVATLHSPMCGAFKPETETEPYLLSLRTALTGGTLEYNMPGSDYNRTGSAAGTTTGGNLAILAHLTGSVSEVDTRGKILFIEDIGEHLYNVDRLLLNLKRAGKLDHLAGLAVGSFTEMQDTERPFGQTIEALISDKVKEYAYPVCFNVPIGHQTVNHTLKLGVQYCMEVTASGARLWSVDRQV